MKKITKEEISRLMPTIRKIVRDNPKWAQNMLELKSIVYFDENGGIDDELFNKLILNMPFSDVLTCKEHGLIFPRTGHKEKLEE